MMILALGVVAATGTLGASLVRPPSFSLFILATYVLTIALIVGNIEVLSLGRYVTERNLLTLQLTELAVVAVAAVALGTLRVPRPAGIGLLFAGNRLVRWLVAALAAVVVVSLGYELALALWTPPNNWDSMTYHLSRAVAWLQRGQVGYVPTFDQRENALPPNSEILTLFTFLFGHNDQFAAVWQWAAGLASSVAIFVLARRCGAERVAALFAALLFACLAQVALQAVTTQNDLLAASLVVAAAALWTSERTLWIGALALGLAIGTKFTTLFALPALCLIALALVPRKHWLRLGAFVAGATLLFGAAGYWRNIDETGSLAGAASATGALRQHTFSGFQSTIWSLARQLFDDRTGIWSKLASEDFSTFGLLGAVVVIPIIVVTLVRWGMGKAGRFEAALAISFPLYIICLAAVNAYNPFMGRFLITPAALVAPLFAVIARNRIYLAAAVVIGGLTLVPTLLLDDNKPSGLNAQRSIWDMNRIEAQTLLRPNLGPLFAAVEENVPAKAHVGYVLDADGWVYPLYGEHFTRHLSVLAPGETYAQAQHERVRWIVARPSVMVNDHLDTAIWNVVASSDYPDELLLQRRR